jgi:hypothetical protein
MISRPLPAGAADGITDREHCQTCFSRSIDLEDELSTAAQHQPPRAISMGSTSRSIEGAGRARPTPLRPPLRVFFAAKTRTTNRAAFVYGPCTYCTSLEAALAASPLSIGPWTSPRYRRDPPAFACCACAFQNKCRFVPVVAFFF